jgi:hypothetical protein
MKKLFSFLHFSSFEVRRVRNPSYQIDMALFPTDKIHCCYIHSFGVSMGRHKKECVQAYRKRKKAERKLAKKYMQREITGVTSKIESLAMTNANVVHADDRHIHTDISDSCNSETDPCVAVMQMVHADDRHNHTDISDTCSSETDPCVAVMQSRHVDINCMKTTLCNERSRSGSNSIRNSKYREYGDYSDDIHRELRRDPLFAAFEEYNKLKTRINHLEKFSAASCQK